MAPDPVADGLRRIEDELRAITSEEASPYDAARRAWEIAFGLAPESPDLMWPLWLIWGTLIDWVEVRPDEVTKAEAAILRAASEWLALPQEVEARGAYFERWLRELKVSNT